VPYTVQHDYSCTTHRTAIAPHQEAIVPIDSNCAALSMHQTDRWAIAPRMHSVGVLPPQRLLSPVSRQQGALTLETHRTVQSLRYGPAWLLCITHRTI
jgi:hypothetical protein